MTGVSESTPQGTVFWITGLPGSGKTTIGKLFFDRLRRRHPGSVFLDGDQLREVFDNDLGYSLEDRRRCARRYSRLCSLIASQGLHVVMATISLFHECHAWNRRHIPNYCEILLRTSPELSARRRPAGLHQSPQNIVGVDLPFEMPKSPDLVIDNDGSKQAAPIADWLWERAGRWLP